MIDAYGYRPNVGIILCDDRQRVLWARRVGQDAWQFPQGGILEHESPEQALYRELKEEVGLTQDQVKLIACTKDWLHYRLPKKFLRRHSKPLCVGQKQIWYLLRIDCPDSAVQLDQSDKPEFDHWRWVSYWHPLEEVVFFKRKVYEQAMKELAPHLFGSDATNCPVEGREQCR